jgi:hypothetical protein
MITRAAVRRREPFLEDFDIFRCDIFNRLMETRDELTLYYTLVLHGLLRPHGGRIREDASIQRLKE